VRSESEIQIISGEINKLLSKGVLEVTEHSDNEIISDIFLRDKNDGTHRTILNLKKLNLYAEKVYFKMDTLHTITKLIEKDCFMASIDLKDAYYSVPITREDRKYLRFLWQGTLFQFTCLPNGLSCAPRKFTKLLNLPSPSYTYGVTYRALTSMICICKGRPLKNVFIML